MYRLEPIESYYFLHNPIVCLDWIWGFKRPQTSIERILLDWYIPFPTDCSGRSTAKTHDKILVMCAKLICMPERKGLLLGQDKKIGIELFDEYIQPWIDKYPNFRKFCIPFRGKGKAKVTHKDEGAYIKFANNSILFTFSADWRSDAHRVQSFRVNHLIFNEWTSFGNMEAMEETVEPIVTRTNYIYALTRDFREATECHIGEPLGLLSNEELERLHEGEPDYIAREKLLNSKPLVFFDDIKSRFYSNFKACYYFDYAEGLKKRKLGLKQINSVEDIKDFFKYYLEGDPVYGNQIFYDGSSKRPSEESYQWVKYVSEKIGIEEQEPITFDRWLNDDKIKNHFYSYYAISLDDIPREYDGLIYWSGVTNKYRQTHLKEDFERVYGKRWIEGISRRPYDPAEIAVLRVGFDDPRYFEVELEQKTDALYLMAIDAAAGTEFLRKGGGQIRRSSGSPGDDGTVSIYRFGDSTEENPDKLVHVYRADDVRPEPMAFDIQVLLQKFPNTILMFLDSGGGGGTLMDFLKKQKLAKDGIAKEFVPILPIDYLEDENIIGRRIIVLISLGTELLKLVHVTTDDEKALWRGGDMLNHYIHTQARIALQNKTVLFPPYLTSYQKIEQRKGLSLSYEQLMIMDNIDKALEQMCDINYEYERRTGQILKTTKGMPRYKSPRKKDLAYSVIYGLYGIYVWRMWQDKVNRVEGGPVIV